MIWFTLFAIPLFVAIIMFVFSSGITLKELGVQILAVCVVAGTAGSIVMCNSDVSAIETWNGQIIKKSKKKESCEHSYRCNPHTHCSGSGKNRSCYTDYDTCYEHSYDYSYYAESNNRETFEIDRVDRQGLQTPSRWENTQIGEPTVRLHSYKNYIKGSGDSLFYHTGFIERFKDKLPSYPQHVFDYWKMNRIVTIDVTIPDREQAENLLRWHNGTVGKAKNCNMIVVLVKNQPSEYVDALWEHWKGANKNDAVLVVSVDDDYNIQWVDTIALVRDSMYNIQVRDAILNSKVFKPMETISLFVDMTAKYYDRKEMRDFEYLMDSTKPSPMGFAIAVMITLTLSIGLSIFFHKVDAFDED